MNPLVIVALVILILIAPKHFKLVIAGAALALLAAERSTVNAWSSYQEFATDYTEGVVRSSDETDNGKLAKALTYCFTINGDRDDFDKILAMIEPKQFIAAMHTPVDYFRSHEIYGGWIAQGAEYLSYPFDVLFLELGDNFDSAVRHRLTGEDLKDILDHQDAAKHYIKKYLEALKRTNMRPPPDIENGTENRFYFAMVETNARVQRTGVFDEVPWEGRPNVFDDIIKMYENYKST